MPKINREEYKILKGLDDRWKWIARDEDRCLYALTEKPVRKDGQISYWGTETEDPYAVIELFDEKHLFQFVQWSNSEPFNIAELIKEYESEEEVDRAYKDGYEKGRELGFYKGYREGLADKGGEPETVADVVTTFWKSYERLKEVMNMEVEELEE